MVDVRGDEWLPEGWKVEIRVRKSGKRDRYYTDPASGYIFRSLKDIDRYLITGKLGRRSMKSKHNDSAGGSEPVLDADEAPMEVPSEGPSKEKNLKTSNGSKKGVQKKSSARSGRKKPASGGTNSNQKPKNRKISKSPHRKDSDDFFILDSDQGADISNELGLPNLPEIIDSVRKSDATYLSAPEIAILLGRQMPLAGAANRDPYEYPAPQVAINSTEAREYGILPHWSQLPTYPEPITRGQENSCTPIKTDAALDSPVTFPWADICSDPCIEFAIKTLTGAIPLGSASDGGDNEHNAGPQQFINTLEAEKGEKPHANNDQKSLNKAMDEECPDSLEDKK